MPGSEKRETAQKKGLHYGMSCGQDGISEGGSLFSMHTGAEWKDVAKAWRLLPEPFWAVNGCTDIRLKYIFRINIFKFT